MFKTLLSVALPSILAFLALAVGHSEGRPATAATFCDLQPGMACAWGFDSTGQLGNGLDGDQNVPDQVDGLGNVVALSAGGSHSLALLADGTLRAWGADGSGQLGDGGTNTDQPTPVAVSGFALPSDPDVVGIAAGNSHSLALLADGTLRAWGLDGSGQLGDGGTNTNQPTPVAVNGFAIASDPDVVAIAGGGNHSLALLANGTLRAWGFDANGQLGDGVGDSSSGTPVAVSGFALPSDPDVVAIAGGGGHSLALLADGTLRAWGFDANGQLGDGVGDSSSGTPVAVSGFALPADPDVVAIAAGGSHSLALLADGTLRAWGFDGSGQLGDGGTNANQPTPVAVSGFAIPSDPDVVAIAGGGGHSLALLADGTLRSWGNDIIGQLGDGGTNTGQGSPVVVSGLSGAGGIAAGNNHSLALGVGCLGEPATLVGTPRSDNLVSGVDNDVIVGLAGNDTLSGGDADDLLCGGAGSDKLIGGLGDDELDGGPGSDTARFPDAAVNVNLATNSAISGFDLDVLSSIENASGSAFADTLIGNSGANKLEGLGGNDILRGAGGNDVLVGAGGNDLLEGGGGADTLSGGAGNDTASYAGASALVLDLGNGSNNQGDTLVSIQHVNGSSAGDTITGNAQNNIIKGGDGNDTLNGSGGKDTIFGNAGKDTINGGAPTTSPGDFCRGNSNPPGQQDVLTACEDSVP
ncbi:MAG: RCC1 repeat-containing protein [Dehalococcoidia bacterium]